MFGISFSELLLVGLVALLVLGPERLPGAARTAGLWIGRLKRSFNSIKQEVEREIGADDIRRQLHNEHILSMQEEAKKILAPLHPTVPPVVPAEPAASSGTPSEVAPGPALHAAEPIASAPTSLSKTESEPAPQPPAPHDPTLPPRAP